MAAQADGYAVRLFRHHGYDTRSGLMMRAPCPAHDVFGICEEGPYGGFEVAVPQSLPPQSAAEGAMYDLPHDRRLGQVEPNQQVGADGEAVADRAVLPFRHPCGFGGEAVHVLKK